jgi:hypothetical protein
MQKSCICILTLNGALVGDTLRAPLSIVVGDAVDALLGIVAVNDVDTLDNNMGSGDEGVLVVLTSVTDIAAVDVVTLLRVLIWWFDEKRN